jgi:hypothetical protein
MHDSNCNTYVVLTLQEKEQAPNRERIAVAMPGEAVDKRCSLILCDMKRTANQTRDCVGSERTKRNEGQT